LSSRTLRDRQIHRQGCYQGVTKMLIGLFICVYTCVHICINVYVHMYNICDAQHLLTETHCIYMYTRLFNIYIYVHVCTYNIQNADKLVLRHRPLCQHMYTRVFICVYMCLYIYVPYTTLSRFNWCIDHCTCEYKNVCLYVFICVYLFMHSCITYTMLIGCHRDVMNMHIHTLGWVVVVLWLLISQNIFVYC